MTQIRMVEIEVKLNFPEGVKKFLGQKHGGCSGNYEKTQESGIQQEQKISF